ncbi:MAG: Trm112 family protein [Ilumatobacteraceae bacterium]|nr:MAG: Trm112 family protein [Actinomycetota bacterium]
MPLDAKLIEVLACPEDHGVLYLVAGDDAGESGEALYNPRTHRRYAVRDGIPVMLIDESEVVDDAVAARLGARVAAGELTATGG